MKLNLITLLLGALLLVSCKEKAAYSKIENNSTSTVADLHKVVVKEVINAGTYAYLNVDEGTENYWMAIPNLPVEEGETYYYNGGMVMKDFVSKQLEKTFDFITFADGIRKTEEIIVDEHQHDHESEMTAEEQLVPMERVEKAKGGIALEELFANKKSFAKKSIIVRGKVVKVNDGIMDRNWVHIEDGTQVKGEKDLTITTNEIVKEGDIVTFKGTVVLDKDFGAGYVYELVLEESVLVK